MDSLAMLSMFIIYGFVILCILIGGLFLIRGILRHRGLGFLDDAAYAARHGVVGLDRDDAVLVGVGPGHLLDGEDAGALGLVDRCHLRQARETHRKPGNVQQRRRTQVAVRREECCKKALREGSRS